MLRKLPHPQAGCMSKRLKSLSQHRPHSPQLISCLVLARRHQKQCCCGKLLLCRVGPPLQQQDIALRSSCWRVCLLHSFPNSAMQVPTAKLAYLTLLGMVSLMVAAFPLLCTAHCVSIWP